MITRRIDCRPYLRQQAGQMPKLRPVNGTHDRAAFGMAHHQNDFGTCHLAGKLHAAKKIVIRDVARDSGVENIPHPQVHEYLGGCA